MKKKESAVDRMLRERKTICAYCGAEKEGISFCIGASREPDWVMVEGTGNMTCPACWEKATQEGVAAVDRHVGRIWR